MANNRFGMSVLVVLFLMLAVTGVVHASGIAYVTDSGSDAVYIVNTSTSSVVGSVTGSFSDPTGVAFSPLAPFAYVTNSGSNLVSIIDTSTSSVVGSVTGSFSDPTGVAFSPDGTYAYVTNVGSRSISIIDTSTNSVVGSINTAPSPTGVAFSPDGTYAYVSDESGQIDVVDTATDSFVSQSPGFAVQLYGVAIAPNGNYAYVTAPDLGMGSIVGIISAPSYFPTGPFSFSFNSPTGVAFSPDGTYVYLTDSGSDAVYILNAGSVTPFSTVSGSFSSPYGVAFQPSVAALPAPTQPTVTFNEQGLPSGMNWSVTVNGIPKTNDSESIAFQISNGTYPFAISCANKNLMSSPAAKGLINVNGNTTVNIEWVENTTLTNLNTAVVTGSGLPVTANFSINIGSLTLMASKGFIDTPQYIKVALPTAGSYAASVNNVKNYSAYPVAISIPSNLAELTASLPLGNPTVEVSFLPDSGPTYGINATVLWNPILNTYSNQNFKSIWANNGSCYGIASTELLYYEHYLKGNLTAPVFPSQTPQQASYTSQLNVGSATKDALNNVTLAILVHQLYDPENSGINVGIGTTSAMLYENMLLKDGLSNGQPVGLLLSDGHNHNHAVLAFAAGTFANGTEEIALSDSAYEPLVTFATYDPTTRAFLYSGEYNFTHFYVNNFTDVKPSWFSPYLITPMPASWVWVISRYMIIASDAPIKINNANNLSQYDTFVPSVGSDSFVDGIPGSSGIEEGNVGNGGVQVYGIPDLIHGISANYSIFDPSTNFSTITVMRYANVSGSISEYGYQINATSAPHSTLNYTLTPNNSSIVVNSKTAPLSLDITFFSTTDNTTNTLNVTEIPLGATQTATFSVANLQNLNATVSHPIVLSISNAGTPSSSTSTYYLSNNQKGLPQVTPVISPSIAKVDKTQSVLINVSANTTVGTGSYQWLEEMPGTGVYANAVDCGTGNGQSAVAQPCIFATTNATAIGTYNFTLRIRSSLQANETGVSNVASVAVTALPSVSIAPQSQTVYVGQTITLDSILANSGSGEITYQWYSGALAIEGDTGSTYTAIASAIGMFTYRLAVTDSNHGTAISAPALVTVCTSTKPTLLSITGSGMSKTVQTNNQNQVAITGSSDNITVDANGACQISITLTGSSDKLNVYNGTVNLTVAGSSDTAALHNTVVSKQTITGSGNKVTGAIINGNSFTLTGSSLVESMLIENLSSFALTGSGSNVTATMLTKKLMATTITGSSNIFHVVNGTISLKITGSSNIVYYHNTTITSQSITGSGNKVTKD
jgi:YVTN family beta-propeller protein